MTISTPLTREQKNDLKGDQIVLVHGSLLSGLGNHRVMTRAKGELIGVGKTVEKVTQTSYGAFPGLTLEHPTSQVVVEAYKVPVEGVRGPLDSLEGYPSFYDRDLVLVELESGEVIEGYIYHNTDVDLETSTIVESGDWRTFHAEDRR